MLVTYIMSSFIEVRNLEVQYERGKKNIFEKTNSFNAVDNVNFDIQKGKIFGLVGESGSGKSTLGKALLAAKEYHRGSIHYHFQEGMINPNHLPKNLLKLFRSKVQLIFQDPYNSLSPRMTVRDIIAEPLESLGITSSKKETDDRVIEIAQKCQLNINHLNRFPHSFSGGQRQRISIARSLVAKPEFIVADESVAALDVSIQAGILQLLKTIQQEMGLTIMFISHDLSVVANFCDDVAVMYLGKIVELAPTKKLFTDPKHPYTKALFQSIPSIHPDTQTTLQTLEGEIPSIYQKPQGCVFQTRCPIVSSRCKVDQPSMQKHNEHQTACFYST